MNSTDLCAAARGSRQRSVLQQYVDRVRGRLHPQRCEHGHARCALLEGGPCVRDVRRRLDAMPKPKPFPKGRGLEVGVRGTRRRTAKQRERARRERARRKREAKQRAGIRERLRKMLGGE